MNIQFAWRGRFENTELNRLHADAFEHGVFSDAEWDWNEVVAQHSLGWVTARSGDSLVGFVNVAWDGFVHAWIQDTVVADDRRRNGVGTELVRVATNEARDAGCEWLHVDFDEGLEPFYITSCGFTPTQAGLIDLS